MSQFPNVEEDQLQLVLRRRLAACRLGVSACAWVVRVRTHMRVVKMAAIARTVRTEKRSSSATKDLRRQLGM